MKRSLAASRRSELTAPPPRKQGEIAIIGKSRSWLDPSTSMTDAELVIAGGMTGGEILTGRLRRP
jgi:hypothetical protein